MLSLAPRRPDLVRRPRLGCVEIERLLSKDVVHDARWKAYRMDLDVMRQTFRPDIRAIREVIERDDLVASAKLTTFPDLKAAVGHGANHEIRRGPGRLEVGRNQRTLVDVPAGIAQVRWIRPIGIAFAAPSSDPRPRCHLPQMLPRRVDGRSQIP